MGKGNVSGKAGQLAQITAIIDLSPFSPMILQPRPVALMVRLEASCEIINQVWTKKRPRLTSFLCFRNSSHRC